MSQNAARYISSSTDALSKTVRNLSSGLRINTSADDASGLAVRELLRADLATARQSSRNVLDGASMVQTADGAAGAIGDSLVQMKHLAVQAANGTYSPEQKNIMQRQFNDLAASVTQITGSTSFNGVNLFQDGQTVDIAVGDGDTISFNTENIAVGPADITTDAVAAMAVVDQAISQVSEYRGDLGATVNRLQSTAAVIDTKAENIVAAESRISDADFAKEAAAMTAQKISVNTGIAAQSQANTIAQVVAMLLG